MNGTMEKIIPGLLQWQIRSLGPLPSDGGENGVEEVEKSGHIGHHLKTTDRKQIQFFPPVWLKIVAMKNKTVALKKRWNKLIQKILSRFHRVNVCVSDIPLQRCPACRLWERHRWEAARSPRHPAQSTLSKQWYRPDPPTHWGRKPPPQNDNPHPAGGRGEGWGKGGIERKKDKQREEEQKGRLRQKDRDFIKGGWKDKWDNGGWGRKLVRETRQTQLKGRDTWKRRREKVKEVMEEKRGHEGGIQRRGHGHKIWNMTSKRGRKQLSINQPFPRLCPL